MNIEYLDEFVYLADTLSFKQTADHFYVSRSVVTRHMAALEEELGVALLNRDSRAVALTEAGEVFYREAKTLLRDWEIALERTRGTGDNAASLVRIGYLRNAARPVLVDFARFTATEHPEVRLSLLCMEHIELKRALDEGAVDIALAINVSPELSRNYRSTAIYDDRFLVVCAPDHPLANRSGRIALEDLYGQKLLLPESYVYSGLSEAIGRMANEDSLLAAREFYSDFDMLNLKVQTQGYLAFTSGKNAAMYDERFMMLEVDGVDTSFTVSAFYRDELPEGAYRACRDGFEQCGKRLRKQT